jgi:hypothetical protein
MEALPAKTKRVEECVTEGLHDLTDADKLASQPLGPVIAAATSGRTDNLRSTPEEPSKDGLGHWLILSADPVQN